MSDAPERIWANFRNWRNPHEGHCYKHDDLGGSEYVRADIVDALVAEKVREAQEARDDAIADLNNWFDRRELAHDQVDGEVLSAVRGYLRTSRVGGMSKEESDMIEGVIADMARLSVFADLFARAALRDQKEPKG